MVASYQALAKDIKSLLISAVVTLEARLKVRILTIFGIYQALYFGTSLSARTTISYERIVQSIYFYMK